MEHNRLADHAVNDDDRLTAVRAATGPGLLDFDGPVTPTLAAERNRLAADRPRHVLVPDGSFIPDHVATTPDPLEVLRYAGMHAPHQVVERVDQALRESEIDA